MGKWKGGRDPELCEWDRGESGPGKLYGSTGSGGLKGKNSVVIFRMGIFGGRKSL